MEDVWQDTGARLYNMLARRWWWSVMYSDAVHHCKNCPQCTVVSGTSRVQQPPLKPIPVERAFQLVEVDIMELLVPLTTQGNKYVIVHVFQDFLTKWLMVYSIPDQKLIRIVRLLTEDFGRS